MRRAIKLPDIVLLATLFALNLGYWWLRGSPLPLALYAVQSLVTYGDYAWDKQQAIQGNQRISESSLHLMELLGGWPGARLAQLKIRHKNRKTAYQWVFWSIVTLHFLAWLFIFMGNRSTVAT